MSKPTLTEGILSKITQLLLKNKVNQVVNLFKNDKEVKRLSKDYAKAHDKFQKALKAREKKRNEPLHKV